MVNGHIGIGISTDPERDVVKTGDKVKERLSQLEELMPVGIELVTLTRRTRLHGKQTMVSC